MTPETALPIALIALVLLALAVAALVAVAWCDGLAQGEATYPDRSRGTGSLD